MKTKRAELERAGPSCWSGIPNSHNGVVEFDAAESGFVGLQRTAAGLLFVQEQAGWVCVRTDYQLHRGKWALLCAS